MNGPVRSRMQGGAVLKATGAKTKKEVVELGLRTLIRLKKQEKIRDFRGKLKWTGDLDEMRKSRL